jgi:HK97 family phage major capsid protein
MKSKELRRERAKIVEDARALLDGIEGTDIPAEINAKFDEMMAAADEIKAKIDRVERLEAMEAHLGERIERRAGKEGISIDEATARNEQEKQTFHAYLRYGLSDMPADLRAAAQTRMQSIDAAAVGRFMAAQSTASDVGGGYLVPESFDATLDKAELAYSGMMEVASIMNTATGNDIHWPTANDTANKGRILGENTQVTETGVSFGTVKIGAYTFSSDLVLVSNELLQDSAINLDTLLTDLLGERIGRKANEVFTTGSGASVPYGIVTQSYLGVTAASATSLSLDEVFFDLPHTIGRAYRARGRFMFNDSTLKAIRKMKDGDGLPIWQADLRIGAPDTVGGFAYTVNDDMADIGTGAKSVLFGDFSKYRIRRVAGARVLRLNERYADYGQVAFLAFQRMDGVLTDAGAHPIKYILHP